MKSKISEQDLLFLGERLRSHYREIVVDGFIFDPDKKAMLLQKRSPTRRLFPNFWDTLGGHLEGQESISECLKREVYEESGLHLTAIIALVHQFEWNEDKSVINLQFVCTATGEPMPEAGKVTEIRWVREEDLQALGNALTAPMHEGVMKAFKAVRT